MAPAGDAPGLIDEMLAAAITGARPSAREWWRLSSAASLYNNRIGPYQLTTVPDEASMYTCGTRTPLQRKASAHAEHVGVYAVVALEHPLSLTKMRRRGDRAHRGPCDGDGRTPLRSDGKHS